MGFIVIDRLKQQIEDLKKAYAEDLNALRKERDKYMSLSIDLENELADLKKNIEDVKV